ncbi:hypothetical protein Glove_26g105 [Diversispora epigaea]|uniref:G-patch domain-containing protein n=1 Tax=Diversispora epigaea TaxID=1348612 RepID=A0A397JL38_9GLOM|nr:hypothetical protein Glove_26g105 [Diversispora epigaea]
MGLAGPKIKQRISANPRNVAWSNDTKKFGHQMLLKMGWEPGKGLGLDENGAQENIKLSIKKDNLGIGASKKTVDNWLDNSTAFDELLKGLNQQINCDIDDNNSSLLSSSSPSSSNFEIKVKPSESVVKEGKVKKKNKQKSKTNSESGDDSSNIFSGRLAHRAKFLKSKKAVMKNTKRINEIMGIKSKSNTIDDKVDNKIDTIDDTIDDTNFERNSNNSDDNDNKEDNLKTNDMYGVQTNISQLNTTDYFASKMKDMKVMKEIKEMKTSEYKKITSKESFKQGDDDETIECEKRIPKKRKKRKNSLENQDSQQLELNNNNKKKKKKKRKRE